MADQTNRIENQEIDLSLMSRKVKGYFSRLNDSFFDKILFIKRYAIILIVLIVLGAGLGIYKDNASRQYEQKIFVIPNFGSTDYLYEEVINLNYKINGRDAQFMKASGMGKTDNFVKIEIDPVVEIYEFIEDKDVDEDDRKFQLFKLIAENGDMKKMLEEKTTSRNYKTHIITITTAVKVDRSEFIDPILRYFNTRPYFLKMQKEYTNNLDLKIAANDTVIKQIDGILNDYGTRKSSGNAMYYVDNTELDKVIKLKNRLTLEQGENRINRVNYNDTVTEAGALLNMPKTGFTVGIMKYVVPFLFVLAFICSIRFRDYYREQKAKRNVIVTP